MDALINKKDGKFSKLESVLNEDKGIYSYKASGEIYNHANNVVEALNGYDKQIKSLKDKLADSVKTDDILEYEKLIGKVQNWRSVYVQHLEDAGLSEAKIREIRSKIEDMNKK